jgi:hypothetical protein
VNSRCEQFFVNDMSNPEALGKRNTVNTRISFMLAAVAFLWLGVLFPADKALGQQAENTLKNQLVGTWILVSNFTILGIILWLPEGYLASRACSAALRLLKVESGINGCLPTAWVPSIYSVSPLSRLRSALEKVSVFCAWKLFARCLAASCQTQKVLGSDLPGSNRAA